MGKDIFPAKDVQLDGFLKNLKKGIAQHGAEFGFLPAEIALAGQICDEYIAQIANVYRMKAAFKGEVSKKKDMRKTHLGRLRKMLRKMKGQPDYSELRSIELGTKVSNPKPDSETCQAQIRVD